MKTFEVSVMFRVFGTVVVEAKDEDAARAIIEKQKFSTSDIEFESHTAEADGVESIREQA